MTGKVEFRGKPIVDEELMESGESMKEYFGRTWDWTEKILNGIFIDDDFAIGQVVYGFDKAWIVGEVVDVGEEYIALEYWIPVDPETVGQYVGLKDKNGVKIFEGDVVRNKWNNQYTPVFRNGTYMAFNIEYLHLAKQEPSTQFNVVWLNGCEVVGHIHDNPELLGV